MKKIIKIENNRGNDLRVEWGIGNTCNYKCWYCFPGAHEGTIPWPKGEDIELLKKNFSHLFDYYLSKGQENVYLYLVGGEPTLWKHLPEFISYMKNRYQDKIFIQMATNGYRKLNWWEENAKYFDSIEISVHREFCDPDHIIEISDYLFSNKHMVVNNILMDSKRFEDCQELVQKFIEESKYNWPIILKPLHFDGVSNYTEEQLQYLKDSKKRIPAFEEIKEFFKLKSTETCVTFEDNEKLEGSVDSWIRLNKLNYFLGWKCHLGIEFLKISFEGSLSGSCWQKLFDIDGYYNIFDKDFIDTFQPEIKPVICRQPICVCTGEIIINKEKVK